MGSLGGFQCRHCRAEFLAAGDYARPQSWLPPVLCCGEPLSLSLGLSQRRVARCPRCDYELGLIVSPAGSLVCLPCQRELLFLTVDGKPNREDKPPTSAPRALEAQG